MSRGLSEYDNYALSVFTLEELQRLDRIADWQPMFSMSGQIEFCLVQAERATYYFRSLTDERMCKVDATMIWEVPDAWARQAFSILALCDVAAYFGCTYNA